MNQNDPQEGEVLSNDVPDLNLGNEAKKSTAFSVASLVLGILSIVCCCLFPVAGVCAVLAVVFAFISRSRLGQMDGMSIAGLVCGIVGLAIVAYLIYTTVTAPGMSDAEMEEFMKQYMEMIKEALGQSGGEEPAFRFFLR